MNKEIVDVTKTENLTYLEALQALKEGKEVEYYTTYKVWYDLVGVESISILLDEDVTFRIKPTKREVVVNGKTFYAEINKLEFKQEYYVPTISEEGYYDSMVWYDDILDNRVLERGIVFLNKEDAIGYARAVLGLE